MSRSRFQFLWSKINRECFLLLAVRIAVSYSVADIRSVACCLRYDSSKHPITHLAASIPFHVILLYAHIFTYSTNTRAHLRLCAAFVCELPYTCTDTNDSRIQLNVTVRSSFVSFTRFIRSARSFAVYCVIHSMSMLSHQTYTSRTHPRSGNVYTDQCLVARLFIQTDTQPCARTHTAILTAVFEQFDETTNTNHDSCCLWTERTEIYINIYSQYVYDVYTTLINRKVTFKRCSTTDFFYCAKHRKLCNSNVYTRTAHWYSDTRKQINSLRENV